MREGGVRGEVLSARETLGCAVGGGGVEVVIIRGRGGGEVQGVDAGFVREEWGVREEFSSGGEVGSEGPAADGAVAAGAEEGEWRIVLRIFGVGGRVSCEGEDPARMAV